MESYHGIFNHFLKCFLASKTKVKGKQNRIKGSNRSSIRRSHLLSPSRLQVDKALKWFAVYASPQCQQNWYWHTCQVIWLQPSNLTIAALQLGHRFPFIIKCPEIVLFKCWSILFRMPRLMALDSKLMTSLTFSFCLFTFMIRNSIHKPISIHLRTPM